MQEHQLTIHKNADLKWTEGFTVNSVESIPEYLYFNWFYKF